MAGITEGNKAFNHFRAQGLNNTDAAIAAGYSNPAKNATMITKRPNVQAHFDEITKEIINERIATARERQEWWTNVMNNDPCVRDPVLDQHGNTVALLDQHGNTIPDFINGGVKIQTIPIKMADRLKATELLGKSQQDFIERTVVDVNVNVITNLMNEIEGNILLPAIDSTVKLID